MDMLRGNIDVISDMAMELSGGYYSCEVTGRMTHVDNLIEDVDYVVVCNYGWWTRNPDTMHENRGPGCAK